jgi:tetratricopeptide (TPR) repeat protein
MERLLPQASAAPADIRSSAFMWLAYYRWRTAAIEAGKDAVEAALASAEDASDPGGRAGALGVLSLLLRDGGDTQGAEDRAREAHRIWGEVGDPWAVAYADILSARAAVAGERLAAAEGYVAAATARYDELGFGRGTMWADVTIALIRLGEGRWPEARAHARRALEAARQLGDPDSEVESLDVLVAVARQRGEMAEATELEAAANRIRRTTAPRTRGRPGEGITSPR